MAREKLIVFGAVTDPQVDSLKGITGLGYTTVKATKTEGGYLINGRKGFGTNSPIGDLFGCTAIYDDPDEGEVWLHLHPALRHRGAGLPQRLGHDGDAGQPKP